MKVFRWKFTSFALSLFFLISSQIITLNMAFALDEIQKNFISKFHLKKSKEMDVDKYYYMLTSMSPKEFLRPNKDGIGVRIFLMKNEELKEKGLMLFNLVTYQCHACRGELWLYDSNGKKPAILLHESFGSEFATNVDITDLIYIKEKAYIFAKTYFMAQGEVERSWAIFRYDFKTQRSEEVFGFYISDTDFGLDFPKCTGIKTKYNIQLDQEKPKVSFYQSGYECDNRKNSKRVSVKKEYYFN